jgi:phosphoglycerol transferase MdoB-like AlkP superfamily enzyme
MTVSLRLARFWQSNSMNAAENDDARRGGRRGRLFRLTRALLSLTVTIALSVALVFATELIVRGSLDQTLAFFQQPFRPGWTTVVLFALLLTGFDALLGRRHYGLLFIGPVTLVLAGIGHQKSLYLGDPLYPTDFLYARQIFELLPLLAAERPLMAVLTGVGSIAALAGLAVLWRVWRRRMAPIPLRFRVARLAVVVPALAFFVSIMDYATFSWTRDRLQIIPKMWDQKENYASNGFALAFALNVPMANVTTPDGYDRIAMEAITAPAAGAVSMPEERPDIIMVMSESFWDPARLPGVTITPDPLPTARALQSGSVFSPEFGGMTANVEFEALTGFSNAFLPYGSIPYQQYVRKDVPSLATFLGSQGYATRAIHPFEGWFWNRAPVYEWFGFDRFLSAENMPPMPTRGPLASDSAFTDEIIRQADATDRPLFLFAVSLQSHGPYEPNRYPDSGTEVKAGISEWARGSLATYAEGMADADRGLARLIDWARKRTRPTVIAFFGDHLPPLGPVYQETGFLDKPVAPRKEPPAAMAEHRQTPLVIWSNRSGPAAEVGAVSPAFLPLHVLRTAGISHPFYTGFLGEVHKRYPVIERSLLIGSGGAATQDWVRQKEIEPAIRDFRLLQYDIMFGRRHALRRFFPEFGHREGSV